MSLYEKSDEDIAIEEEDKMMRQGVLVTDLESGRMDIRFGLEEYDGGWHCGTTMDVNIYGKWVPHELKIENSIRMHIRRKLGLC